MLNSVTVINPNGESLKMGVGDPDISGLLISNIEGLGSGECNINLTEYGSIDGAIHNSSRKPSRNIVIDIIFKGNPTIEDSRQLSYKYFSLKSLITLEFITDNNYVSISGFVESNEPNIFDKQEGTSISILCPNPYFRKKPHIEKRSFNDCYPLFEFPFSNESLDQPLIEFSEWKNKEEQRIDYEGNTKTGILMSFYPSGTFKTLNLSNGTSGERLLIDGAKIENIIGGQIADGDWFVLSTIDGKKSLTYYKTNGQVYNVLNAIDFMNSEWVRLYPGTNTLFCSFEPSSVLDKTIVYIEYDALLEGI